ncbi:YjbQ family protein [Methanosalsum natronophilum]|uniref:YjbQ family protein n=1 Tax=Methanosalsum natronophilum TaxID=768733 RepID=A0A424YXQ2_9EURY|nr:MAG: YjbQ family protein [Methanosalsum natronophilum]
MKILTRKRTDIIDITSRVNSQIQKSDLNDGICVIYSKHTTNSLVINENEKKLLSDISKLLAKLIPDGKDYLHDSIDNNAAAHLKSTLLNNSLAVPFKNKELELGRWQSLFLFEFDGPRERNLLVSLVKCDNFY